MNKNHYIKVEYTLIIIILVMVVISSISINPQIKNDKNIIYRVEKKHKFISNEDAVSFKITLSGKDTLSGVIKFEVTTHNNNSIYNDEFPAIDLIGYGLTEDNEHKFMHKDSCIYIIERMNNFFSEENFLTPAIHKGETFVPDFSEEKIWNDIASDSTAIGFYYLVGEENNKQIAYSKKKAKVVVYKSYD